ncbi:MAG: DUF2956 domain-containing protein [Pseudomonadales bacterium]
MTGDKISKETQAEALTIAKASQKPRQTKEQTKLIAHGIEKGISEYKKQQKIKGRERDKLRKKELRIKNHEHAEAPQIPSKPFSGWLTRLPWFLLAMSWIVIGYLTVF